MECEGNDIKHGDFFVFFKFIVGTLKNRTAGNLFVMDMNKRYDTNAICPACGQYHT